MTLHFTVISETKIQNMKTIKDISFSWIKNQAYSTFPLSSK